MPSVQIARPLSRMCASQTSQTSRRMSKSCNITTRMFKDNPRFALSSSSAASHDASHNGKQRFLCAQRIQSTGKHSTGCTDILLANTKVPRMQHLPRYFTLSTSRDRRYKSTLPGGAAQKGVTLDEKEIGDDPLPVLELDGNKYQEADPPEEQFDDYRIAYASKTTWELCRTMFFFFLFQFEVFTNRSQGIMNAMKKVMGKRLSEFVLKKFIYEQFVAGETTHEILQVVKRLQAEGVGPLIAVPIEDDVGTMPASADSSAEERMDQNLEEILNCMDLCVKVSASNPMFQLKMTALMSPNITKALSVACSQNPDGDSDMLCPASVHALVQGMRGQTIDIPQIKEWENLTTSDIEELKRILKRFQIINEAIVTSEIVAMVDAEYTYLNPALRHMTFAMMEICNHNKPLVFYTYQAYLKKTFQYLKSDMATAKRSGLCFGAKLVRGAYIVKERHLAQVQGYPDPVNNDFEATSENYRLCLEELLQQASRDEDRIRFIIASHNEDSVRYALRRMQELGVPLDSKSVIFGQLYGMADHVSFTLGKKGYQVVKSVPYGTVDDVIPYLSRRAHENRSILDNARKEKQLVKKALWQRVARS